MATATITLEVGNLTGDQVWDCIEAALDAAKEHPEIEQDYDVPHRYFEEIGAIVRVQVGTSGLIKYQ